MRAEQLAHAMGFDLIDPGGDEAAVHGRHLTGCQRRRGRAEKERSADECHRRGHHHI